MRGTSDGSERSATKSRSGTDGGGPAGAPRSFLHGVFEALAVPLAFVAVGLSGWVVAQPAAGTGGAGAAAHPYPPVLVETRSTHPDSPVGEAEPEAPPAPDRPALWLVDGFNVLQVVLLGGRDRSGWWTRPQREALLARVAAFEPPEVSARAADHDASADERVTVQVVFDGARPAPDVGPSEGPPGVVFAPSADDWILARIRASDAPERIAVVSADRRLAARARRRGAQVISPAAFLARCPLRGESASV